MSCVSEPFVSEGLQLCHDPERCTGAGLAGHLHPVVRLRGPGRDSLRLPCFLLRREVLILPAFSRFVDGRVLQLESADCVFAVSEQSVISVK
jgi:metallophosphoesterase superfamily enzyme